MNSFGINERKPKISGAQEVKAANPYKKTKWVVDIISSMMLGQTTHLNYTCFLLAYEEWRSIILRPKTALIIVNTYIEEKYYKGRVINFWGGDFFSASRPIKVPP